MELPKSENTTAHWGWVAKSFHWVIAILVLAQIPLGFYGHNLFEHLQETGDRSQLDLMRTIFALHKSTGLVLGALIIARCYWRLNNEIPPLSQELPHVLRLGALIVHWAFYVLILTMAVTGFIFSEHSTSRINFYLLVEIPQLFDPGEQIAQVMKAIHKVAAYTLTALVLIHTVAAFVHHFVMKDDTLVRMLPGFLGGRRSKD